ncbi:Kae1-associated serine/threonine protein kinase [Candidatus Woesearchaeota archaeon]|nr:Kae1-associated serine/threonine protein kinase [Candidatus Woesearchaeota archaeon]
MEWHGAEAKVRIKNGRILKERIPKKYRHPALDKQLRQSRTRRESKILEKLHAAQIPVPKLLKSNDENMSIHMEHIEGKPLKEVFHEKPLHYAKEIGILIGKLHTADIVHGDLTTSNMVLHPHKGIHLIDFGLSFFSTKEEDKAVDLHVLDKAIEAKHYQHYPKVMQLILQAYKKQYKLSQPVLDRLKAVQKRGRHQQKKI